MHNVGIDFDNEPTVEFEKILATRSLLLLEEVLLSFNLNLEH